MIFSKNTSFFNLSSRVFFSFLLAAGIGLVVSCEEKSEPKESAASENAPVDGDDVAKGKDLYIQNGCAGCHGESGLGDGVGGQALNPKPRILAAAASYKQGSDLNSIATTIGTGIPGTAMVAYPHIPESDRKLIASFIKSLQK